MPGSPVCIPKDPGRGSVVPQKSCSTSRGLFHSGGGVRGRHGPGGGDRHGGGRGCLVRGVRCAPIGLQELSEMVARFLQLILVQNDIKELLKYTKRGYRYFREALTLSRSSCNILKQILTRTKRNDAICCPSFVEKIPHLRGRNKHIG